MDKVVSFICNTWSLPNEIGYLILREIRRPKRSRKYDIVMKQLFKRTSYFRIVAGKTSSNIVWTKTFTLNSIRRQINDEFYSAFRHFIYDCTCRSIVNVYPFEVLQISWKNYKNSMHDMPRYILGDIVKIGVGFIRHHSSIE